MKNSLADFTEVKNTQPFDKKEFISEMLVKEDVADRQHSRRNKSIDVWSKTIVTLVMTVLVVVMNWYVVDMVNNVINQEIELIKSKVMLASERSITTGVFMALIGGTVAEVSALFFIIVKSIFKTEP
ncbi:hypothetical protein [Leclercia barmai]|uniref:Uncharacterized protein n=1 Tax=Leclercia barmai TaxID=2785629 RepID=A0ABS7S2C7_9ENTR|nr:hypothetical protein [Leclercia sp. EMC7]MBZ0060718.1 hypothetical protein [Leclercia sp. EMC7]